MPEQTHYKEKALGEDGQLRTFLAIKPTGRAVVFVHGWNGDALDAWADFQTLLPECSHCYGHDLFFYDFDGLRMGIVASAALFREVLEELGGDPTALINGALDSDVHRSSAFRYEQIVVVGHSLGAVIARWAIVDGIKQEAAWPKRVRCVFFAPAHSGASVLSLAGEAASGFKVLGLFTVGAKFLSPLISELAVGSAELTHLAVEAEKLYKKGHQAVRPSKVFVAAYENVVKNLPFPIDPPPKTLKNTTHTTICKPKRNQRAALDALLREL